MAKRSDRHQMHRMESWESASWRSSCNLKEIDLTETNVTATGVRELQKPLPACRVLTIAAFR
jgi:hypothetical protein